MEELTKRERDYILCHAAWTDIRPEDIVDKFDRLAEQYKFDATIPIEDLREHVERLQDRLRRISLHVDVMLHNGEGATAAYRLSPDRVSNGLPVTVRGMRNEAARIREICQEEM